MQKLHTGFARHGAEADFFQERVWFSVFCTFQRSAHAVLSDKIRLADHESVAQFFLDELAVLNFLPDALQWVHGKVVILALCSLFVSHFDRIGHGIQCRYAV